MRSLALLATSSIRASGISKAPLLGVWLALVLALIPGVASAQEDRADWLDIELGKSIVLETTRNPSAIAITDPSVIFVTTLGVANKLHVQGKKIGTTDLVVQFGGGIPPKIYEVTVHRDLSELIRRIDSIVEDEPPRVYPLEERIVVQGAVPDLDTLEQVALVSQVYDVNFVNLMTVKGDHQVQLEVTFAEVSRTALRELGLNAIWGDDSLAVALQGPGASGTTVTTGIEGVTPATGPGAVSAPGAGTMNIGALITDLDLGVVLSIVDDHKLGKILAQPTLVSLSGQKAEFVAGGEIPVPAPGGQGAITIQYKEFGVILAFVPTVLASNVVDMLVHIEISEIDAGAGTSITGITVPGFITRKGKSHMRIESGQTFAMAGLLSDSMAYSRAEIPGLGRLPLVGALFRTVKHERDEREVMIFVTPKLIKPLAPSEVPAPVGSQENNNPSDIELFLLGMDHRPGSRKAQPAGSVGLQR